MTSDPNKPPHPEDDRERTARFEPGHEAEGEGGAAASGRESTARFIPEEEPPQLDEETTSILSAEELAAAEQAVNDRDSTARIDLDALPDAADVAAAPFNDRDSTARIELPEPQQAPAVDDRDSTARLLPEELGQPDPQDAHGDGSDQEATRREITPMPRLPNDSFSAPHTPAPGTRLEVTSPEQAGAGPGATTRSEAIAREETVREQAPAGGAGEGGAAISDAPTRADSPLSAQSTRKEEITPIEPLPVSAVLAETAPGRGPAGGSGSSAADTTEEEYDKPYSLQPSEVTSTGTQGSAEARPGWRIPMPLWFILFLLLGGVLFAGYYFKPRTITFPLPIPRTEQLAAIAIPGVPDEAPRSWALLDGLFYGKNVLDLPWVYDPATGKTRHARDKTSAAFAPGQFTVVAHPPLEAGTRLAWILADTAGPQLYCRDYNFTDEPTPAPLAQALNTIAPLPAGTYPHAPLAIDTADHAVGTLLVVVSREGAILAYRPESATPGEPFWSGTLGGTPLAAPVRFFNGDANKPVYYVLVATDKGLESFDSISGARVGQVAWSQPVVGEEILLGAQRIADNREHWGLMAWDGSTAFNIETKTDGQVALLDATATGEGKRKPVRMIGFPDAEAPAHDGAVLTAEDGTVTILTQAAKHELKGARPVTGVTTIDLNGDGYWELLTVMDNGEFWIVEGSSLRKGGEIDWTRSNMANYAAAPATRIYWHIAEQGLLADYFDAQGVAQRLAVDLPAYDGLQRGAIVNDFNRRRVLR